MTQWGVFYTFPERGWIGWNYWHDRKGLEPESAEECESRFLEWARSTMATTAGMHYMLVNHGSEKSL